MTAKKRKIRVPMLDAERRDELRGMIKESDIVSFDVFDTLLMRSFARPVEVFRLTHELLNQRTQRLVTDGVAEARVKAEVQLRDENWTRGHSPDAVTFDAIWQRAQYLTDFDDELIGLLAQMELEAERAVLRAAPAAVDLFRFAVDQGKEVVLVSDTYLPSAFIAEVLEAQGIVGWSELVVSCEAGAAKSDGNLWAELVRRHSPRRILHLGDNYVADVEQPRAFGVDAQWLPKAAHALRQALGCAAALNGETLARKVDADDFRLRNTHRSLLLSLPGHLVVERPEASTATAIGYGALGPLLVGYSQWLHRSAVQAGHDHLFFLARDGHLMREAYQALLGEAALPSTYLLASRRLCNVPALADPLTVRDVNFLTQTSRTIRVREYFSRLGIDGLEAAALPLLEEIGLSPDEPGEDHQPAVRACFWRLSEQLLAAAQAERATLLEYWEQAGLLSARRPAVVDIGWHGSLEQCMRRVLGLAGVELPIAGFYLGLHHNHTLGDDDRPECRRAFVDGSLTADKVLHKRLVLSSVSVLEFCFTRPEGTVVGLQRGPDGRLEARHAPDAMGDEDRKVLTDLQQGALDYVRDFAEAAAGLPYTVSEVEREAAIEPFVALVTDPTARAADVLGRRLHGDGFGIGVTWEPIGAPSHDADHYRHHPEDIETEVAHADWQQGYVRNALELGVDVPTEIEELLPPSLVIDD